MIHCLNFIGLALAALLTTTPLASYTLSIQNIEIATQSMPITGLTAGETLYITSIMQNPSSHSQSFSHITEIVDENGFTVQIKWSDRNLASMQTAGLGEAWIPEESGNYTVKVLVWRNINSSPIALAEPKTTTLQVE